MKTADHRTQILDWLKPEDWWCLKLHLDANQSENCPQFTVVHTVKGFSFFMIQQMLAIWSLVPLPFLKPAGTSGSSRFMYCWNLENFEHYFTSVWDECNCVVVWAFLALPFFGIGMKIDLFQYCDHCWVFQIFWHIECCTLRASSFRIWNSSTGIPSPPLALFVVMVWS